MSKIHNLLQQLKKDFPGVTFTKGESFLWSPREQKITYTSCKNEDHAEWSLLHEVAHAMLEHTHYGNDFELLTLETAAWQKAQIIGNQYNIHINTDHIQDCLDTYRDWLHKRAKCPSCSVVSLQRKDKLYQCFNCKTTWSVPNSPLCRVTRRVVNNT